MFVVIEASYMTYITSLTIIYRIKYATYIQQLLRVVVGLCDDGFMLRIYFEYATLTIQQ